MFEKRWMQPPPLLPASSEPYAEAMPVSARDVAAELRERIPGIGVKKLHKLLYYCQGHHLATFGKPLFSESIAAWDMGPVVSTLWRAEKHGEAPPPGECRMGEAELNTIGYVVSRYGALSGNELERLTHSETPWQRADSGRISGYSAYIDNEWIREYFASAADDDEGIVLDSAEVARMLAGAEERRLQPRKPDDLDKLRAMIAGRG